MSGGREGRGQAERALVVAVVAAGHALRAVVEARRELGVATAVTAVLKNDFILISLFIFIEHIVYVSATMSRVKSQKAI